MEFNHKPVLLEETMAALAPRAGGRYVDGTCGGGGHARALLERVGLQGRVLGLDQDPAAIAHLESGLAVDFENFILRQTNYSRLDEVLAELDWAGVDGMILDLGISSYQLEGSGRGFSFGREEPLDMRMDPESGHPASALVNRLPEHELANLIFYFGEERGSRRIARAIVAARRQKPFETAFELAEVVRKALWRPGRKPARLDPATRTFQALRIAVNRELEHLETFLAKAPGLLNPGGRLVVISFHSLEDRMVKQAFVRGRQEEGEVPKLKAIYKKPLRPSPEEEAANPRSRSAKLRAGERTL
jgi:16S rRNA (cytosine1402-N4)-methyltransferase